ncbi:SDR family NAD(P)-dependent oxidoreductase [Aquibium microcysteis]|uniref:SDR family NAD(P)-dependent oxidoreductase n=1 Tax=Aquibium microcysteis TaxID=675281 RepID=UPI00165CEF69|nr:SDR family NAD(P)-dependent oxidoreductase [Aquibium microcysteis]
MSAIDLSGKVAVVTGAASGIGRGLAERFAGEGMRLVLADIEQAPLDKVAEALRAGGADVVTSLTDVADAAAVGELADTAWRSFGAVHVVCNNAGVVPGARLRPIWETTPQDWQWSLGVNLMGVVHGIQSFVPRMRAQGGWGHVVNTISVAGLVSGTHSPAYGASKHAALRATEALYANLRAEASPIGVTALCPGVVATAIGDSERNRPAGMTPPGGVLADSAENLSRYRSAKRHAMEPAEVADMVVRAIRLRIFYVVTTRAFDRGVRERMESILDRRNPDFTEILAMSKEDADGRS